MDPSPDQVPCGDVAPRDPSGEDRLSDGDNGADEQPVLRASATGHAQEHHPSYLRKQLLLALAMNTATIGVELETGNE
jgi:hypothetical protein